MLGYILCHTCKLKLSLGKLRTNENGTPCGFSGLFQDQDLNNRIVNAFIAEHLRHEIQIMTEFEVDELDNLVEYDSISTLPDDGHLPAPDVCSIIEIAGQRLLRMPCEPHAKRRERLERIASQSQEKT